MITYNSFTTDDIPSIVKLMHRIQEAENDPARITEEALRHQLQNPILTPEKDIYLAKNDDTVIGMSFNALSGEDGQAMSNTLVDPLYHDTDILQKLVDWGEAHIMKRGETETPPEKPLYVIRPIPSKRTYYLDVMNHSGYEEVRRFYEMSIDLDTPIEAPELPLELRPFDPEAHAKLVYDAEMDIFKDHWGQADNDPYDAWSHRLKAPNFDPALWYTLWEGEEIAAICLCRLSVSEPGLGLVDIVGVRRAWRKRGIALVLLRYVFAQLQARGMKRVQLHVDSDSETNAVALYERAGMHIRHSSVILRKVLRGNPADIED